MIITSFIAEPIMTTSGQLVGCELLTRFHCQDLPVLNSKYFIMAMDNERKRELLTRQLQAKNYVLHGSGITGFSVPLMLIPYRHGYVYMTVV